MVNNLSNKPSGLFKRLMGQLYSFWYDHIRVDSPTSPDFTDEKSYRRTSALVLGLVTQALLFTSGILNILLQSGNLAILLFVVSVVPVVSITWLICDKKTVYGPMLLLLFMLMALGAVLLFGTGVCGGASFVWFILFPPMLMYSMGVRHGTMLFACFYAFLVLSMVGPLQSMLAEPLSLATRLRFLLAMLGSFAFSGFSELVRQKTNSNLALTVTRLEQEALTDQLTGLGNRRDFQNHFAWVKAKSHRVQTPFALAMLDIDHFKNVNDTYGHEVGDRVLVHITTVITERMRATDKLFRWGGEEFIIMMMDTWPEDARHAAERIRQFVADTPYMHEGRPIYYSVSIGLYCSHSTPDINEALAEADRHLYVAKHSGRNQVVGEYSL